MNKKTKRYSLTAIALIAIVPLSIIALASSVMAACSMSIGVQCEPSYGKYETFEGVASVSSSESRRVDYSMTIELKDPSGHTLAIDSHSGYLSPGQYNKFLQIAPPSGGWQPGTYAFCNRVFATGVNGCSYSNSICKGFTGPPDQPDLEITDVWDENGTIYYKIKNTGTQAAGESNTSLTVDGVFMTSDSVASIDPSVEVTETFDYSWECTDINDSIEVCADYTNAVTESDELNNCRKVILTCSPTIWISPTSFNIKLLPDVVSNHILTVGNSGNSVLEFNITNEFIQSGWPKTTGSDVHSSSALGDIDGDGDIEVVVGSWDKKVYAWHHDGSDVTGWPRLTGNYVNSSPVLGDIDGDGDIEVVVGSNDGKVYAWHHDGSDVTGWPKTTGYYVYSSPALGDIDGDGDIEVVVGSNDNKVYAWDCFGTYDSNNIEWAMFRHDIRRTGLYGYVLPSIGSTGAQTALNEVGWLSEDPTNGTVDPGTQASITVTLDTTSLDFGDYYADIIITSNDPDENPLIIPVHLTVGTCLGDFDGDGDVDGSDLAVFAHDFGRSDCSGDCPGDFDGDLDVDGSDFSVFATDFGQTDCPPTQ